MDSSGFRTGGWIAGVGAVALLIVMFLPWLGIPDKALEAAEGLGVSVDLPTTSAWKSFTFLDVALLVPVIAGIALAAMALGGTRRPPPMAGEVTAVLGALGALAILYRIINPLKDASLEYGIWLGLVAALAIAYGGWSSMRGEPERAAERPEPERPEPERPAAERPEPERPSGE